MKLRLSWKGRSGSVRNGLTVDLRERMKGDSDGDLDPWKDRYGSGSFELGRLHIKQGFAVRVGSKGLTWIDFGKPGLTYPVGNGVRCQIGSWIFPWR